MIRFKSLSAAACALLLARAWLVLSPTPPSRTRALQPPVEGDYVIPNFHFASGEALPELRHALHDARQAAARRARPGRQRGAHPARHGRQRPQLPRGPVRRRAVRQGPAARRQPLLHHPARRHRPRRLEQAERRLARAVSRNTPTRTWSRPSTSSAHPGPARGPSAAADGHLDGLHAHLDVGRALSGRSWTPRCRSPACRCRSRGATGCGAI